MATTTRMGITLVEESQSDKEITINEAFSILDNAAGITLTNAFTGVNSFMGSAASPTRMIAEDAAPTARAFPFAIRHQNSGGVGGVGMGSGVFFEVESATEGVFNSIGSFGCDALVATAGSQSGRFFM